MAAGILLSRIFGLVRQRAIAYFFGLSLVTDAFNAALRLPNLLQNLLGEGTLSASVVPIYAELLEEGREEEAGRFAGAILGILMVVSALLVLLGILLAPWIVPLILPEWDAATLDLTVRLTQTLFPMIGLQVWAAWALAVLNAHRRFFLSYVAPVFWNASMIGALIWFGWSASWPAERLVFALAWGGVVGGALQLGVQLPTALRLLRGFRLSVSRRIGGVAEAIRNFIPVVLARGAVNISGFIDLALAGLLAAKTLSSMSNALTLYILPISLFGMSVAASELPELARARTRALGELGERMRTALDRLSFFIIPSVFAYLIIGDAIVGLLYETGAFGRPETLVTYGVLAAYSLGLYASASSRVFSSAFYALRDTRTPARLAYLRIGVSLVVSLIAMFPLDQVGFEDLRLGAAGLGIGASVGAWTEYWILRRRLSAQLGPMGPNGGRIGRMIVAALIGGAVASAARLLPFRDTPELFGVVCVLLFGVGYLLSARALRVGLPILESLRSIRS